MIREKLGQILRVLIPIFALFLLLDVALIELLKQISDGDAALEQLLMFPVIMLQVMVLQIPVFHMNARWLFEADVRDRAIWKDSWRTFFPFLFRIVLPYFIQLTILAPLLITLWNVLIRGFYRPEVLFLEGLRGKDMRKRISSLTSALQVFTFWLFHIILFWIAMFLALTFFESVFELLRVQNFEQYSSFSLTSVLFIFLIFLYSVFFAVSRFLFYVDARTFLEGWDLELQFIRGLDEMTSQKRIS
ncbi:MAG TPA: hypothetical protein DEA96_17855 [Leptospiraceae bacterium]|nr:hypothetical protein [Spirochaetaceae bacterium]HBS06840.1 hypothetical protein [Leptospiraceae bacterium]